MKHSAGFLIYKFYKDKMKVFLVHPGGPYWKNKDEGAWSIPKGEVDDGDLSEQNLLAVAKRELKEETGVVFPEGTPLISLGKIIQRNDKTVHAWAYEGDWSGLLICSSSVVVEWPAQSGKTLKVPEVDRAGFFPISEAKKKINSRQVELIDRLLTALVTDDN